MSAGVSMRSFGFQWHVTDRCNRRCRHCYQSDFTARADRPIEDLTAMADRIFAALPDRRVSVNVTGGEPLLYPRIFDLLAHLHAFPNLKEIHVITNGTCASGETLARIRALPKIRFLKVSLEAGGTAVNDAIRGKGNFAEVRANVARFRAIAKKQVVLMATLGKHNAGAVGGLVRLARRVGAAGVIFERFVPLGHGRGMIDGVLGPREWHAAAAAIARAAKVSADPLDLLVFRAFWVWTGPRRAHRLQGALCNLGGESMALMPDGTVYPCRRLPIPVGNVLTDRFETILGRLERYAPARMAKDLRGSLCGICGVTGCAGCRALARALTGDVLSDDPQCGLQVET